MNVIETNIQTLTKLGLTPLESKVFLTLLSIGKEKITTISTVSSIDRSNTHQIIKRLQEKGLVNEILGKPNRYESIPLKSAILILKNKKHEEYKEIEKEANELIKSCKPSIIIKPNDSEFKIVKRNKETKQQEVINAIKDVERCFDLIISQKDFHITFVGLISHQLECVKRGIQYRVIIEEKTLNRFKRAIKPFLNYSNFQIKYVNEPLSALLGVADKKWAYITLETSMAIQKDSARLITNNPACLEMFGNHFDKIWSKAQEYKKESSVLITA